MNDASSAASKTPTPCAGVVCFRGDDVLLIRRGTPPLDQQWSIPGGRIGWGERAEDAALRELKEETDVDADLVGLVDVVNAVFGESESARHYVLIDYAARWTGGEPIPGDDAIEARFVPLTEIEQLGLWDETLRVILLARLLVG
jgi:8-oxo-dGTP diphosphatase